jgi:hypothetical protein
MTKKIIIVALIPSLFIYLTGCYSMHDISKEDLKTAPSSKLWVMTNNGDSYLFRDNAYRIQRDTLIGEITNENRTLTLKAIPLADIASLQTETINGGNTFLAVLGSVVVITGIVLLIYAAIITSDVNDLTHH